MIWVPAQSIIDVAGQKWDSLLQANVQKIAVANPQHAPYGRAAVEALKHAGIYDEVQSRLVYGENISQAAQFVQSGSAQVGIIALSLAVSPAMKSRQAMGNPSRRLPGDRAGRRHSQEFAEQKRSAEISGIREERLGPRDSREIWL